MAAFLFNFIARQKKIHIRLCLYHLDFSATTLTLINDLESKDLHIWQASRRNASLQDVWVICQLPHGLLRLSLHLFFRNAHHRVSHHTLRSPLISSCQPGLHYKVPICLDSEHFLPNTKEQDSRYRMFLNILSSLMWAEQDNAWQLDSMQQLARLLQCTGHFFRPWIESSNGVKDP